MSTTTITTEQISRKTDDSSSSSRGDPMFDSGFSGSLRLSLHNSMTDSTDNPLLASGASSSEPAAKARDRRDSGTFCQDFSQLNINNGATSPALAAVAASGVNPTTKDPKEAWKEFYEPDEDGDVQLHLAIASGFVDVVYALIRLAPHPDYLSIQNNASYSPLHIAVLQNQPALVRRLVIAGARLDVRDKEGNMPLHLAARRGHLECGEALMKPVSVQEMQEAQLQPVLYSQLPVDIIDLFNHNGENCVHLATMGGHVDFLRFLCWNNANMNAEDGRAGRSALHFAVGARNLPVIQCLVNARPQGCGVHLNQVDWYGRTPYQLALANGMSEVATFLSRVAGCDVSILDESSEEEEEWRKSSVLLNSSA